MTPDLADHFFRHEYSKLVATLSRRVGVEHIEAIEDAVQLTLIKALETWSHSQIPENPTAWLFKVAHNQVLSDLRQQLNRHRLLEKNTHAAESEPNLSSATERLSFDFEDDQLRLLFTCCDDAIPLESQLVFALKTLCGFSVSEIALRLFITDANVYKRLSRAKSHLQKNAKLFDELDQEQQSKRLAAVQKVLYLLFTEGHLSSHAEIAIRRELCAEAIRLTTLLAKHPIGKATSTSALLALMHLHYSRMSARENAAGGLVLLEEQDRSLWDGNHIALGLHWLANSAEGDVFSRYHAEAGIAAEHCLAPSFDATNWQKVVECYELLEHIAPSAIHTLNRAVALAQWQGPEAGILLLKQMQPPSWLESSYLWAAVQADLHRRSRNMPLARSYRTQALEQAPTQAVKKLLARRLWLDDSDS